MFGSSVLDIALGIALLYSLLSLLCSAITEGISDLVSLRARSLRSAVQRLLGDPALAGRVLASPLLTSLADDSGRPPSRVPAAVLAAAVIDELQRGARGAAGPSPGEAPGVSSGTPAPAPAPAPLAALREALARCDRSTCPLPLVLAGDALSSVDEARRALADWLDAGMERAAEVVRRNQRRLAVVVAIGLSVVPNVDSFRVAESLARERTLREAIVAAATRAPELAPAGADTSRTPLTSALQIERELEQIPFPIGWEGAFPEGFGLAAAGRVLARRAPGWSATALAVSFGAAFWLAVLERLLSLRRLTGARGAPEKEANPPPPGRAD